MILRTFINFESISYLYHTFVYFLSLSCIFKYSIERECKRNFKWRPMHRSQCPIHNGTKSFVWSSMKRISMFIILKTNYFQLWFLYKVTCAVILQENIGIAFNLRKITILISARGFKGIVVICYLCLEDKLKLRMRLHPL